MAYPPDRGEGGSSVANERPARSGFLTVAEVAELLRVSNMTVYRLINAGQMNAVRVGRSYRITEDEVDRYVSAGLTATA